jgi:hypothetical protein
MTATMTAAMAPAAAAAPRVARPLATIEGTMLTPGVSLNKRLYTRDAIARAVSRMKERLGDPAGLPIVMRTHHDAGDNSRLIVGRIVDVAQQPDTGAATYQAELFDTTAGRDISTLIGQAGPALKSTSIYGYWLGPVEQRRLDGDMIETAADLEIDAIDFTASPGVPGAQISRVAYESVASGKPVASGGEAQPRIQEPGQATITPRPEQPATWPGLDEVADRRNPILEKYTAAQRRAMAAKGQARSDGSYPVASKSDLRNAIKAVGSGGGEDDGVRRHIIARAEALGLAGMIPAGWHPGEPAQEAAVVQQVTPPAPAAAPAAPATPPAAAVTEGVTEGVDVTVCVSDQDGPIVRIIASGVDPDEVKQVTKRAAKIAARALNARDNDDTVPPDMTVTPDGMPVYPDENHTPEGTVTQTPATTQAAPNPPPAQQRWSITVNGEELAADEAKALVAAALTTETRQPADTPPAAETTPVPAAPAEPATAPVVDELKGVAVSDTKVAQQATTPTAPVEAAPAAPAAQMSQQDLIAMVAEATAAAVARALKAEKKTAKATEAAPAAPAAVAETTAPAVPAAAPAAVDTTQTTPVAAAVTHAQMEERLKATVDQLREQLLKERGLPPRRGHRYVTESEEATGPQQDREDLWDNRSQVWDKFFPASMTPAPAAALAVAQDATAQ